jgi:hypothetical protein
MLHLSVFSGARKEETEQATEGKNCRWKKRDKPDFRAWHQVEEQGQVDWPQMKRSKNDRRKDSMGRSSDVVGSGCLVEHGRACLGGGCEANPTRCAEETQRHPGVGSFETRRLELLCLLSLVASWRT